MIFLLVEAPMTLRTTTEGVILTGASSTLPTCMYTAFASILKLLYLTTLSSNFSLASLR